MSSSPGKETSTPASDYDDAIKYPSFIEVQAQRNLLDKKHITDELDCLKLTDNQATMLLSAFMQACGGNIDAFVLSISSIKET